MVTDNGPGIREEDASQIFTPMFTTKSFGTGLGLPMVQQILAQHGGGVEIASAVDRGTRVTLRIPRDAAVTTDGSLDREVATARVFG